MSDAKVGMRLFRNERIRGAGSRGEVRGRSVRTLAGRARVRPAGDAHCVATRALEANMAREADREWRALDVPTRRALPERLQPDFIFGTFPVSDQLTSPVPRA